mmetsp:Transcript_11165/g.18242  ORF Transcript_11165/g.18242 Transcript_11165/m.18242 type:complete len:148 (-) Transcript_11165:68-511(-)
MHFEKDEKIGTSRILSIPEKDAPLPVEKLEKAVESLIAGEKDVVFVLFTGNKDASGLSWCGDCRVADPIIRRVLKRLPSELKIVVVPVGDRSTYKTSGHPYRTDKKIRLTAIPTLIPWSSKGPINKRLVEGQIADEELLQELLTAFD